MTNLLSGKKFSTFVVKMFLGLWIILSLSSVMAQTESPPFFSIVCQSKKLKIVCPHSYVIRIDGGTYGRTESGETVCPYAGYQNDFYYNCGANDVKAKLIDLCDNQRRCTFIVGKALFGDPCRGHAYMEIIYTCVPKKRKKNKKNGPSPSTLVPGVPDPSGGSLSPIPSGASGTHGTLVTTHQKSTYLTTTNSTNYTITTRINNSSLLTTLTPTHNTSTNVTGLKDFPDISATRAESPGIFISIIMWIVYVKGRWPAFSTVFLISIGVSLFVLVILYIILLLIQRRRRKHRGRHSTNNKESQFTKLNPTTTVNGDIARKTSELDTLSNTFPAPISSLPPPPDDMIYPSPSPEMLNPTRPPPPPVHRGSSLDDISKIGKERNKNVEVTRSMSMRTARPPDYYSKDVNYDNFHRTKLQPIVGCPEINTVLKSKDQTMYTNPMYENGLIKEVTC